MVNPQEPITCPSCQTVNQPLVAFCQKCGAPIGPTSTLDPWSAVRAENYMLGKMVEGRPKPVVLAGVWIVFGPCFLVGTISAVGLILTRRHTSDFFWFWLAVGLASISFVFLYRVTRNYLKIPPPVDEEGDEE